MMTCDRLTLNKFALDVRYQDKQIQFGTFDQTSISDVELADIEHQL